MRVQEESLAMRYYETIFILNPTLSEDDYGDARDKFKEVIEKFKGVIIKVEEWGTQRLAYEVRKFDKGTYVLIKFCGTPDLTGEFERELKLDDRVILFQTVKLSDNQDPDELLSLANDPQHAERLGQMMKLLAKQQQVWDDTQPLTAENPAPAKITAASFFTDPKNTVKKPKRKKKRKKA